jgi:chaperonin cofactor prefoldin
MTETDRSPNEGEKTDRDEDSGTIRERVERLREKVSALNETLDHTEQTLREAFRSKAP